MRPLGRFGLRTASIAAGILGWTACLGGICAPAQTPSQIVSTMAAHEVAAKNEDNLYAFTSQEVSARTGGHRWTEKVVETRLGPLRRLIAVDGKPLTPEQARAEVDRINEVVRHPDDLRRLGLAHKDEEVRAGHLLELLPRAFLITPAGEVNGCTRFAFRANPAFEPSTYEERVAVAMTGTVAVRQPEGRLCALQATISRPVEFGFGVLGRIEQGGHFSLERTPVDAVHWKSDRISVHVQGRILLFKTLAREQDVVRTDVRLIPGQISLAQAAEIAER